jgi:hypothetical protein
VRGPVIPLTFPKLIDVGVTPVSDAVLPAVPVHSAASAAGAKLNPADVAVAAAAGALVAPPVEGAAPALAVRTADPEPTDPELPPNAWAGVLHGAEVDVVVVEEALVDFDLDVVVVDEPDLATVVDVAAVLDGVEHGTVVALPAAWATPLASVPPPDAPRYGETLAPHDVTIRDDNRSPSRPADLLLTCAPRTQAYIGNW